MINCLIIDDERPALELIKSFVAKIPSLHLVKATTNPEEALVSIGEENIQLIFSDIQMADVSGIEIAKAAKGRSKVIFISGYSEYAIDGYEHEVVDYLLKPVPFPRFLKAVEKAERIFADTIRKEQIDCIYVKMGVKGKLSRINTESIDYIEANGNYVAIHHGGGKTLANSSLKEVEEMLPKDKFIRVHKSYIIQSNRISGIEGNRIILKGLKDVILLSDTYKSQFLNNVYLKTLG